MPRGNPQNLDPCRSKEVAMARGRLGGIKSGESKRARKTMKEELLALLAEGDTQKNITLALLEKAMTGDTKAYEVIRDTAGEKPVDKVMVADVDSSVIADVEFLVTGKVSHSVEKSVANSEIIICRDKETGTIVKKYDTIKEAAEDAGLAVSTIKKCLRGGCKSAGGYRWERDE